MFLNHVGKLLVRFKPLPAQLGFPVVEELARPGFRVVGPELIEGFPQDVSGVQPLIGIEEKLEAVFALAGQVLGVREQDVFLTLDEGALVTCNAGIFCLADFIEGLAEVTQNVELVEQDGGIRGMDLR